MCGRYTLQADGAALRARFPLGESVQWQPRYNVAPGDEVLAITLDSAGSPRGELLQWGLLPSWAGQPDSGLKLINARVETVAERAAFKLALERFHCLILADGFYEWQTARDGGKQPFHISRTDRAPFAFAGLWSRWRGSDGSTIRSCAILTTAAGSSIAWLHDRMPVILAAEAEEAWLDARSAPSSVRRLSDSLLSARAVSRAVNDARYDGPYCLAPPQRAQASLF